jgi:hypothetical protein
VLIGLGRTLVLLGSTYCSYRGYGADDKIPWVAHCCLVTSFHLHLCLSQQDDTESLSVGWSRSTHNR